MNLPYPAEQTVWKDSGPPTAADAALLQAEFEALYANDNFLLSLPAAGRNSGGIARNISNPTTLPPDVLVGSYDIIGTPINVLARVALSVTANAFKYSNQALDNGMPYRVVMDASGNAWFVLAFGPAISGHTGTLASVAYVGTTGTLTKSTGTIGTETGNILVISGGTPSDGVYLITGGDGSSLVTFVGSGSAASSGTYAIYSPAFVATPVLNTTLNQYVVDTTGAPGGTPVYRDLGAFYTDATGLNQMAVAYGQGASKYNPLDGLGNWQAFPSVAAGVLITTSVGGTNPTYGTVSQNKAFWRRSGDTLEIRWDYRQTGAGSQGAENYILNCPSWFTGDTNKGMFTNPGFDTGDIAPNVGTFACLDGGSVGTGSCFCLTIAPISLGAFFIFSATDGPGATIFSITWGAVNADGPMFNATTLCYSIRAAIPCAQFAI